MMKFYIIKGLRYIVAIAGGALVASGDFDPEHAELYIGSLFSIGAFLSSVGQSAKRIKQQREE